MNKDKKENPYVHHQKIMKQLSDMKFVSNPVPTIFMSETGDKNNLYFKKKY